MTQKQNPRRPNDIAVDEAFSRRPGYLPAVFLFALASAALAWPWLSGRYTIPWDAKAEFYPQLVFLAHSLHAGEWPFWAPNVFGGQPQIADPQSLIFSLPFLLLAIFHPSPGFQAADAAVFVTLFLGGVALMMFFRDRGWHPAGALLAAFVFSFGASNAWRIQHVGQVMSLCWFAVSLWTLARALQQRSIIWGVWAGLSAAMMIIGRDQIALLCTMVLAAWTIARLLDGGRVSANVAARWKPLAAAAVVGAIAIAVPVAMTAHFAAHSNRPLITYEGAVAASLHPAAFLTLISADLFGTAGPMAEYWGPPNPDFWSDPLALARNMADIYLGALPVVLLLLAGGVRGWLTDRNARFFSAVALFAVLYALGQYTPFFKLAYMLPGADMFRRPADATFPLGAAIAIMTGYLLHRFIEEKRAPAKMQIVAGAGLVIAALLACVATAWAKGRLEQALLPLAVAAASFAIAALALTLLRKWRQSLAATLLIVALVMGGDLAFNNAPNESTALPPGEYEVLKPGTSNKTIALIEDRLMKTAGADRRDRVEMPAVGFAWPDAPLIHGFDHSLGYNPLVLAWYAAATGAIDHVAIPDQRKFSPLFANYKSPMLNLLGVRLIASGVPLQEMDKSFRDGDLPQIARTKDAYIYENVNALPRVIVATSAHAADFEAMIASGKWPDVDFRNTVLLQPTDVPPSAAMSPRQEGERHARILAYRNTEVIVETTLADAGWLVLHDTWHPWWYAEVDGKPAKLLRANVIFRAVAIPAGRHVVRFTFRPFAGLMAWLSGRETTPAAPSPNP